MKKKESFLSKYKVGIFVGILLLLGGLYRVTIYAEKIEVELPSDICSKALLRVTKDDFTLKCGNRIAFQADTIVEYFKTYGPDEWVRNNRYVGRNKKDISLELIDRGHSFDIIRSTRYRKGKQYVEDGILEEIYHFTKDSVKISYHYTVNNKAKHKITMRIKKQHNSYLNPADPTYTGIRVGNLLYYEGKGDLFIDPQVDLTSYGEGPTNYTILFNEGDTISMTCNATGNTSYNITNISLYWNAGGNWTNNGTVTLATGSSLFYNASATFTRIIPPGNHTVRDFNWSCEACSVNSSGGTTYCNMSHYNYTINPLYYPNRGTMNITTPGEDIHLNLLSGSLEEWDANATYYKYMNDSGWTNQTDLIQINFTHPSMSDNATGVRFNLSFWGVTNATRRYGNIELDPANGTTTAYWNTSNLTVDRYWLSIEACNEFNDSLCINDTIDNPIDIFDYTVNLSTKGTKLRFTTQPTTILSPALGQSDDVGVVIVNFLHSSYPDGLLNLSLNYTAGDKCMNISASEFNNSATSNYLTNSSYEVIINDTNAASKYIWLWATKEACTTTTTNFQIDVDLFQ